MIWRWIFVLRLTFAYTATSYSIDCPSDACSDQLYPLSSTGAIKLSNASQILFGGGSDSEGFLDSNFKVLGYSDFKWSLSILNGESKPFQANTMMDGFQSPIFCSFESSIIFLDLSNDPPNMFTFNQTSWSWTNLTMSGTPPLSRQLFAKTCTESKIYIHSGIGFKTVDDDSEFWEFDIQKREWKVLPNIPKLWGHSIGVLGTDLFALGGNTLDNKTPVPVPNTDIWRFDLTNSVWEIAITKFYGGGTITPFNDSLIIYGGHGSSFLSDFLSKGWVLTRLFRTRKEWDIEFIDEKESINHARQGHSSIYDSDLDLIISLGGSDLLESKGNYTFVSIFNMTSLEFIKDLF